MNEKAHVTFPDETEIECVILGEDELGNYKCSALENNGKYKQGDIFYCNEDTHEIVKTAKLTKLSGLKKLLSNYVHKKDWGFDIHKSPWKYNKVTGMIEKDPEALTKIAKLIKTALFGYNNEPINADNKHWERMKDAEELKNRENGVRCPACNGTTYVDHNGWSRCRTCGWNEAKPTGSGKKPVDYDENGNMVFGRQSIKAIGSLIKSALDEFDSEEGDYQLPQKEERYAVELDFYITANSDEEAFQKADVIKDEINTSESGGYSCDIKNVYKIPTGTMNFNNKPLQRKSKLDGIKFLLSHALDPKITNRFDNSLKAVKYHLFQYSGNDDVNELQEVANYLSDLLTITKEQIASHHEDERPEYKGSNSSEESVFRAMQGGTD